MGFYWRPALIPSLNFANGSQRQQRSERREACVQALGVILRYLNLTTLCVGIPTPQGFVHLSMEMLRERTTLGKKRFYRAIKDLKLSGIITIKQPCCQKPDGNWMGQIAIKSVSKHLFKLFGLSRMLYKAQKYAARVHKEKDLKSPSELDHARFQLYMRGLKYQLSSKSGRKKPPVRSSSSDPP